MRILIFTIGILLVLNRGVIAAEPAGTDSFAQQMRNIEARSGGRIGVAAFDTGSGRRAEFRAQERFPMCSTFKMVLAAAVLQRVDRGEEKLDRIIHYSTADLLSYAPITKEHVNEGGLTVDALCDAALRYSDNTAANLLLTSIGGPTGWTAFVRLLGDEISRLDRPEEALNSAIPADERDTTSPAAMLATMRKLLLGDALTKSSRDKLETWLRGNTTGAKLIRAGAPAGWTVGDKTGRGANGTTNDIAILRPPQSQPFLLCIYTTGATVEVADRDAAIAETARLALAQMR